MSPLNQCNECTAGHLRRTRAMCAETANKSQKRSNAWSIGGMREVGVMLEKVKDPEQSRQLMLAWSTASLQRVCHTMLDYFGSAGFAAGIKWFEGRLQQRGRTGCHKHVEPRVLARTV
eukprot:6476933-Amphidinium_carterae.1